MTNYHEYIEEQKKYNLQFEKEYKEKRQYANNYNYIYSLAILHNSNQIANQYAKTVLKYTKKYKIDTKIFARKMFRESEYITESKSSKGAFGPNQIIPRFYLHLLYIVDNGSLKPLLQRLEKKHNFNQRDNKILINLLYSKINKTNKEKINTFILRKHRNNFIRSVKKYFYEIDYSVEMSCLILQDLLKNRKGSYKVALNDYNVGPNAVDEKGEKVWNIKYVNYILEKNKFEKLLKRLYDWEILQIKKVII